MKKPSLIGLSALILISACTKTETQIRYLPQETPQRENLNNKKISTDLDALRSLLDSKAPNLALAELLAKSIAREHSEEARALFADLTAEEAKSILLKVEEDNSTIRENYLFRGQLYMDNKELIRNSLLNEAALDGQSFSIESQLKLSAFAYLKSKALDEIISAYDKRAQELAIELSTDIAIEIGEKYPETARAIEKSINKSSKEEVVKLIAASRPVVEKIDTYFRTSNLNENEQYAVVLSGIIAGAIYVQVKDKDNFQRLIQETKKIIKDVQEFKNKAKEFSLLVNSLEGHLRSTANNLKDLGDGMSGARKDLNDLFKTAREGMNNSSNIQSRRIMEFLHDRVIKGKMGTPDGSNESIFSKQVSFNKNFTKSLEAAGNLTSNLNSILVTTTRMSQLLGIKPSEKVLKVIDKVQKVNAVIHGAQAAIQGFATGGFIGAMGALSSGPMMSMLGGAGSQDSARLDEISKKLDVVIRQQEEIMKMQVETMNMIKELALMVDMYHQREMAALAELRNYQLVEMEMEKAALNKDIRSCERMINYQLASVWKSFNFGKESFNSINNIDLIKDRFTKSIQNLGDIRRILTSVEEDGFQKCQSGIAEAFGGNNAEENPLRAIFSSRENVDLYAFQRDVYGPLVLTLESITKGTDFDSIPLHLPTGKYETLLQKNVYVMNSKSFTNDIYEFENLISVKNLERYLGHLLILGPILELDKGVWQKNYQDIVTSYIKDSNIETNQNSRSHYFLNNALKLVQSSIAQEALLAGEPLLPELHNKYFEDIFSGAECDSINRDDVPYLKRDDMPYTSTSFFCAVRSNRLLMKNLLNYHLSKLLNEDNFENYENLIVRNDLPGLAKFLNLKSVTTNSLEYLKDGKGPVINVLGTNKSKISIKLPTSKEVKGGRILYSENMPRLIKMQELILNNLEKVAPLNRKDQSENLIKLLMTGALI